MIRHKGWLLDVYADKEEGAIVWFIDEEGSRLRFTHQVNSEFYLAGHAEELGDARRYINRHFQGTNSYLTKKNDLYEGEKQVLSVVVENPYEVPRIDQRLQRRFPDLGFFSTDIAFPLRYHASHHTFPMAQCEVLASNGRIHEIKSLDSPWDIYALQAPLRVLSIVPDVDPSSAVPSKLKLSYSGTTRELFTSKPNQLLKEIIGVLESYDPDLIATLWGDSWLLPQLGEWGREQGIDFNPNRDKSRLPRHIGEAVHMSYGRKIYRDQQTLLFGRLHIDPKNAASYTEYGIWGILELARVTGLPIQNAARRSPGGAFTAMQVIGALRRDTLIPLHKERMVRFMTARELDLGDNGGMIFQPTTGLHFSVAELDFFSMYPSIMYKHNISAETVGSSFEKSSKVPVLSHEIDDDKKGLTGDIIGHVIAKRENVNNLIKQYQSDSQEHQYLKGVSSALKWLGLVSFGFQGFSGNRIGSVEAHQAISAISREFLLRAKNIAESSDYSFLHGYVDSLFIKKDGISEEHQLQPLINEIELQTGLRIKAEGIFRWIAFLPSKQNDKSAVPNCYFGVFKNNEVKARGIMARRRDTPPIVSLTQMEAIGALGKASCEEDLSQVIPIALQCFCSTHLMLSEEPVSWEDLKLTQKLSRELSEYKTPSPVAIAGQQLADSGKSIRAGQNISFVRTTGKHPVLAWNLIGGPSSNLIDWEWYAQQLMRAAHETLQPFGLTEEALAQIIKGTGGYQDLEKLINGTPASVLPLFEYNGLKSSVLND